MSLAENPVKYQRCPESLSVDMDGDMVAMNIDTGGCFGISGIGPIIWELIETPRSIDELVSEFCREFDVDAQTARADLDAFMATLVESGMAQVC